MKKLKAAFLPAFCLVTSVLWANPRTAQAWGYRGHQAICVAATWLVQNPDLRAYLKHRSDEMGYLCNIPDVYWRSQDENHSGDPGHYFDIDVLKIAPEQMPETYEEVLKKEGIPLDSKKAVTDATVKFGALFWRANQFYQLAIKDGSAINQRKPPKNHYDEQDWDLPYNESVFKMTVMMGILGHYPGDDSMPYHVTSNRDGWNNGHGGVHSYYEQDIVNEIPLDLDQKIYKQAQKLPWPDAKKSVVARLVSLALLSEADIKKADEADHFIKPSEGSKKAVRRPAIKEYPKFQDLIVVQMARSAKMLAQFWDEIYVAAGKPDLTPYKSYKFPTQPRFIPMDFVPLNKKSEK
jgi:hypothetical protein